MFTKPKLIELGKIIIYWLHNKKGFFIKFLVFMLVEFKFKMINKRKLKLLNILCDVH